MSKAYRCAVVDLGRRGSNLGAKKWTGGLLLRAPLCYEEPVSNGEKGLLFWIAHLL